MEDRRTADKLVEDTLELADRAFRELFPILPEEWLTLDTSVRQLKALLILHRNGSACMSEIASALETSPARATRVVDQLVDRGFVIRESDPVDRRLVLCRLSDQGRQLAEGLWQPSRQRAETILVALSRPELMAVGVALEALLEAGESTRDQWQLI